MNVVLKDPAPSISWKSMKEDVRIKGPQKHGLQHHLTVCEFGVQNALLLIEFNHTIMDGLSYKILCENLQAAYNGTPVSSTGTYRDFVAYLEEKPHSAGLDFWTKHLDGVEPCYFPTSLVSSDICASKTVVNVAQIETAQISEFCAAWDVTPATIIQTAWALVLGMYTETTIFALEPYFQAVMFLFVA